MTSFLASRGAISGLAAHLDMSRPAVSKHMHVLQRAGLATIERQGCVRKTSLNAAPTRWCCDDQLSPGNIRVNGYSGSNDRRWSLV